LCNIDSINNPVIQEDGAEFIQSLQSMQGKSSQETIATFKVFLRTNKQYILIILTLACLLRLAFVITSPPAINDALGRYIATANNILAGHGFTTDQSPPYIPGEATVPLYPLFIASVYGLFGQHEIAVKIFQVFCDLITCLLVAFISFKLAPARLKKLAARSALILYGLCSWFTMIWTSYILTETLAIFLTVLVITLCLRALEKGRHGIPFWFGAGAACGLAILTRPDSLLLMGAVGLFLLIHLARRRSWEVVWSGLSFCCSIMIVLAPWTARNYISLGKIQPLASQYGLAHSGFIANGYLTWLRTWVTDETYSETVYPPAESGGIIYDAEQLPESAFESADERQRVTNLIAQYNEHLYFNAQIDNEFCRIAESRIARAPIRFYVVLPIQRAFSMWLTGTTTKHPKRLFQKASEWLEHSGIIDPAQRASALNLLLVLKAVSVLPLILGGALGFALWCRRDGLTLLLLLLVLTRTVFMSYYYAPETRYIVEAYPPMLAACGVTTAVLWLYLRRLITGFKTARQKKRAALKGDTLSFDEDFPDL
jgi:4-amino-4-deoxy-L-arabinose transferase-like glycosyltransferase